MGKEVAVSQQGGAVAAADQWAALANQYSAGGESSGVQFLKFDGNNGEYTYGSAREELPLGSQLAVNMASYSVGFICWKDGQVVDEVMVPIVSGKGVNRSDLTDHGPYKTYADGTKDGWSEQRSVDFKGVEDGTDYQFKTTSKSGLIALGNLLRDFAKAVKLHDGEVPIVEASRNEFTPKNVRGGDNTKKYAPAFKITAWAPESEIEAAIAENAANANEEEPEAPPPPPPPPAGGARRGRRF